MFGFLPEDTMTYEAAIAQIVDEYQSMATNAIETAINLREKLDVEYPLRGFRDGRLRWVRAIGNLAFDKEGKPTYFSGVLNDITIQKQDEIRKNDFIAMVSHELRTPLTSIQAYVQVLAAKAEKAGDNFAVISLEKANRQVRKMAALINGFLSVSSSGAGKIYLNVEAFEISALVSEIIEELALTTTSHKITLLPCSPLLVKADRDKIGQVINNFLSNALKYSPKGGNIDLSCQEFNSMLQVSVKDNGMGIKPQDKEKLFDRYYRIENVQTQSISGFGLGLYLSAEIIYRHNGKIWVESEPGKGSTFYFSLPL
jgi:two-component system CheB/CheR fusion protein